MCPGSIPGEGTKNMNQLTKEVFYKFAEYIYNKSGILLKDVKITLLEHRLKPRLKELNFTHYEEYWDYLQNPSHNRKESLILWDLVTTHETYFYRGHTHFDILYKYILPELVAKKDSIRIWCAGCSSGEEAYDIAMVVNEFITNNKSTLKFSILATDISHNIIKTAQLGVYPHNRVNKLPQPLLDKYTKTVVKNDDITEYHIHPILKKNIIFRQHNLCQDIYPSSMDIIFCRNVMIYFDPVNIQKTIQKFHRTLNTGGFLLVSQTESLQVVTHSFVGIRFNDGIVYFKEE